MDFNNNSTFATPPAPSPIVDYKSKDFTLYNKWKDSQSKEDMSKLVQHLQPLIYKEVSRASGTLPVAALNAEGKVWAVKAIKSYDPSKGFALSTHVTNYLQRVRRMNAKYQLIARLPEDMKYDYPKYNLAIATLSDELNRDPTDDEIAAHLGWSKGLVIRFKKRIYAERLEDGDLHPQEVTAFDDNSLKMRELFKHLTPDEKFLLENKGKMSATQLANKLGVNNNRLNYLQNKLVNKIKGLKVELEL